MKGHPERAVPIEAQTSDTGERSTFFGLPAHHLVTEFRRPSNGEREVWDGWYIDRPAFEIRGMPCPQHWLVISFPTFTMWDRCLLDLPLNLLTAYFRPAAVNGSQKQHVSIIRSELTVEEYSDRPLDPSLFRLPFGYRENPNILRGAPKK